VEKHLWLLLQQRTELACLARLVLLQLQGPLNAATACREHILPQMRAFAPIARLAKPPEHPRPKLVALVALLANIRLQDPVLARTVAQVVSGPLLAQQIAPCVTRVTSIQQLHK
jgi:hypothetical protein